MDGESRRRLNLVVPLAYGIPFLADEGSLFTS